MPASPAGADASSSRPRVATPVWSITLKPNPVQMTNLNEPIESGWADAAAMGNRLGPEEGHLRRCRPRRRPRLRGDRFRPQQRLRPLVPRGVGPIISPEERRSVANVADAITGRSRPPTRTSVRGLAQRGDRSPCVRDGRRPRRHPAQVRRHERRQVPLADQHGHSHGPGRRRSRSSRPVWSWSSCRATSTCRSARSSASSR